MQIAYNKIYIKNMSVLYTHYIHAVCLLGWGGGELRSRNWALHSSRPFSLNG